VAWRWSPARCRRAAPKLAETVRLRKNPDGVVHLFHPETGERIN
jgi:multiple sugar transport system ATP-binding protein